MPATSVDDFADQLRRYRRRGGLTQAELAERAAISPASISLLERGITQAPQKATVGLLSAALTLTSEEATAFHVAARRPRPPDGTHPTNSSLQAGPDGALPVPLTSLFGREREEEALASLLARDGPRLLTLTGPAGVGKTRLVLQLAAMLRHERGQDIVFVGLIPVQDPDRVLPAIAQSIGIRESGTLPLRESLVHVLRDRELVLVLDNFEQVLPAARGVLELLIACPRVKALVTSRSALNVRGERCFPVAPLALPDPDQLASLDDLFRVPTIALFIDRASAARPDFSVTTVEDGRLVAGICVRLDGLPLAIELAAARIRHLSLRQLHDRLGEPTFLSVLAEGPQDLADHQRTMRSTIAWSYDQLDDTSRQLFRALGVFVGGATLDAVEAVSGMTDEALAAGLDALLNASLLQSADAAGARRYTQLVTLRAFAQERLRAAGEWDTARQRHAEHFRGLTNLIDLLAVDMPEGLMERLEIEHDNVRAALRWALETSATALGLRMVGPLWRFWQAHSYYLEGLDWFERFVAQAGTPATPEDQAALAEVWTGVMVMAHRLDRFERAREAGENALALWRALGSKVHIAGALSNLGNPLTALHENDRALALYAECLAILRELNNRPGMVFPLLNLGGLYYERGQPREALTYYEESLALSREFGESDWARGLTWSNIGEAYVSLDDPSRAVAVVEPAYQLFTREHDHYGAAACAFTLGRAAWRLGELVAACAHLDEAERLFRAMGSLSTTVRVLYFRASLALEQADVAACCRDLAQALHDLAGQSREREYVWCLVERAGTLARHRGDLQRAARLYAAAIARRDSVPGPLEPSERDIRTRDLATLRTTLGEDEFAAASHAGRAMTLEQATALTREELQLGS
ncbi:MAG TPA: tetratricopeptide repeat protein [Ktedonobacterales bacterium]|jgi:predicted ATPase/DNA-binding XRE family transcriptional regulator|nr:tetratricopeptide repeat protein [Ktedonobacterales bacterium]